MNTTAANVRPASAKRSFSPPIPHEHGAWVILYAPALLTFGALRHWPGTAAILLLVAVTGLFLGRNAAGLLLRGRGGRGVSIWLGIYSAVAAFAAIPLLTGRGGLSLLTIGLAASVLFTVHTLLLTRASRKRLDRSQWGELLAIAALTLTSPAAYAVTLGKLDAQALILWAACTLYFGSGIFFVKMLLGAVKVRGNFEPADRARAGRQNLVYHVLLVSVLIMAGTLAKSTAGWIGILAFAPAMIRAFAGYAFLTNTLPPLKKVGYRETLYTLWFAILLAWAFGM